MSEELSIAECSLSQEIPGAPSPMEAKFYYHGIRSYRMLGPTLIYRTSKDIFPPPCGSHQTLREIQVLTVHNHDKLSYNNLWDTICDETAEILDRDHIKYTSIDLVRFRLERLNDAGFVRGHTITPVTVWIGVLPNTITTLAGYQSTHHILTMLKGHGIEDIDIAIRESRTRPLAYPGPILHAPVNERHPLKKALKGLTTVLSLPIAALKTPQIQGTLGFYFKAGGELYGVTSRHVMFPPTKEFVSRESRLLVSVFELSKPNTAVSTEYERKYVVLMGTQAFEDHLSFVEEYVRRSSDDIRIERERFLETFRNDWSDIRNRIIGHVVWSPPIAGVGPPDSPNKGYMKDICVIKLDKHKFLSTLRGNAIDLGAGFCRTRVSLVFEGPSLGEDEANKLVNQLYPDNKVPQDSDDPRFNSGFYPLKSLLPTAQIKHSNVQDNNRDLTRFVFKQGSSTGVTVGRLNGFLSRVRRYTPTGHIDSNKEAVYPYDKKADTFPECGDSGAAIVGSNHEFIAHLTAGTGPIETCDITYATPMKWLWDKVIKPEFPDADLFFGRPTQLLH